MSGRIAEQTVEAFLRGLASDDPTPGGGAVAALSGATGAALISMVQPHDRQGGLRGRPGADALDARAGRDRPDRVPRPRGSGRDRVRRRDGRVQDAEGNRRREGGPLQGDPGGVRVGREGTAGDRQARGRTDGARARDHRHRQRAGGVRRRVRRAGAGVGRLVRDLQRRDQRGGAEGSGQGAGAPRRGLGASGEHGRPAGRHQRGVHRSRIG